MKALKKNMIDHIWHPEEPARVLHCPCCMSDFSGNAGDYWDYPDDYLFKCGECGEELELVERRVTVEYV